MDNNKVAIENVKVLFAQVLDSVNETNELLLQEIEELKKEREEVMEKLNTYQERFSLFEERFLKLEELLEGITAQSVAETKLDIQEEVEQEVENIDDGVVSNNPQDVEMPELEVEAVENKDSEAQEVIEQEYTQIEPEQELLDLENESLTRDNNTSTLESELKQIYQEEKEIIEEESSFIIDEEEEEVPIEMYVVDRKVEPIAELAKEKLQSKNEEVFTGISKEEVKDTDLFSTTPSTPEEVKIIHDTVKPDWFDWEVDYPAPYVEDIAQAIGFNDKLLFTRVLFESNELLYRETLQTLNKMEDFKEALNYMRGEFPNWDESGEEVYRFYMGVRRKLRK